MTVSSEHAPTFPLQRGCPVLAMLQSHHIHGNLHVKAALDSGDLTEVELREIAVQIACYAGWPVATSFEWTVDKATGKTSGVEDL